MKALDVGWVASTVFLVNFNLIGLESRFYCLVFGESQTADYIEGQALFLGVERAAYIQRPTTPRLHLPPGQHLVEKHSP